MRKVLTDVGGYDFRVSASNWRQRFRLYGGG